MLSLWKPEPRSGRRLRTQNQSRRGCTGASTRIDPRRCRPDSQGARSPGCRSPRGTGKSDANPTSSSRKVCDWSNIGEERFQNRHCGHCERRVVARAYGHGRSATFSCQSSLVPWLISTDGLTCQGPRRDLQDRMRSLRTVERLSPGHMMLTAFHKWQRVERCVRRLQFNCSPIAEVSGASSVTLRNLIFFFPACDCCWWQSKAIYCSLTIAGKSSFFPRIPCY